MLNGRKRAATALIGLVAATAVAFVPASPAQAEPDIDTVKDRVDRLYHQAEQASERYNDVRLELDALRDEVSSLRADEERQGDKLDGVRSDVRDSIITQYQGQTLSAAGQVLSADTENFLDQMSTMSSVGAIQDDLLADYGTERKALGIRSDATADRLADVEDLEQQLADEKDEIDERYDEATSLLDRLEDEQREALLAGDPDVEVPTDVPASGRAQAAVDYAMAQVGKAYVYGAAGPSAFDCSGLTMMAWAQAGVGLPHSSSAQYSSGTRISVSEAQPGDLIFYYSPISHVAMYIGNGMIVHAANPGAGVRVDSMSSMPITGAVRPG